jgi:dolichyl-phosphate-mannose--protein O-mannosyl transferase
MTATLAPPPATAVSRRPREALRPPPMTDRLYGWLFPLLITVLAGALRFYRITSPPAVVNGKVTFTFDEVYYTTDAHSLLQFGVERGQHCVGPGLAVHPPLGKWMMAVGEWMFGYIDCAGKPHGDPALGWRFSAAVVGTLAVLIFARTARRMFRSTLLGCFAGLLLSLDGMELVHSRTGLLDIFLLFWILAALAAVVRDRDWGRERLADGRKLGFWRPWRLLAGFCLGCAMATKWTGLYAAVALSALVLAWDIGARRAADAPRPARAALRRDAGGWLTNFIVVPTVVYTASFTGWFVTHTGYMRNDYGKGFYNTWRAWWHWHQWAYDFAATLTTRHPYQSDSPFQWLVQGRPTLFAYTSPKGCGSTACSATVLDVGNPAIWWVAILAVLGCVWLWLARRDWRAALVLVGVAADILPWLPYPQRTKFNFYALPMLPFLILGLCVMAGLILGRLRDPVSPAGETRRLVGSLAVGAYAMLVLVAFGYFFPIWTNETISHSAWQARIWFPGWF